MATITRVVVTGVGGGVGQSIVKCLQDTRYSLIGVDGETLGTGLYAVQKAYKVPYASAHGYIDRLIDICRRESCSLIFPGLDAELAVLSRDSHRFKQIGAIPVVSSPDVVDICGDKLATCQFLTEHGFQAPLTFPLTRDAPRHLQFPMVLKPRKGGARSRGFFLVSNEQELSFRVSTLNLENYVVQEYVAGEEYTCGSVNFEGRCYGTIVMRRILRDGDTYKAFVVTDEYIHAYVKAVAELLKPFGPCNFQLRVREGKPYIFEINARSSGTTHSRALAGFNEPLMVADYLTQGRLPSYKIREISILRYWKELVVENSRIRLLEETGSLTGDGGRL